MKNSLYVILAVLLTACNQNGSLQSKKDELAGYKAEADKLKEKIARLEHEIALMDTLKDNLAPKLVSIETLEAGTFNHFIDLQGEVVAENQVVLQPGMPGIVTLVNVKEGDKVSTGQVLAETDNRAIRENIAQLQVNLELAKTAFEKQQRLWKQQIGSEIQFLQAKTQYESLQKSIAAAQAQLDLTRIKSPITGVVDQVNIKTGELAAPSMFGAFQVINNSRMKVVLKVPDSYISKVKIGDPVSIYLKDLNDTLKGSVGFIAKAVNSMSRTFTVEVKIEAGNKDIRPNMLASASINDERLTDVISVPANLIQKDAQGKTYVLVAKGEGRDMKSQKKFVQTGLAYGNRVVITSGLESGEKIIRNGFQEIVDGQPLELF